MQSKERVALLRQRGEELIAQQVGTSEGARILIKEGFYENTKSGLNAAKCFIKRLKRRNYVENELSKINMPSNWNSAWLKPHKELSVYVKNENTLSLEDYENVLSQISTKSGTIFEAPEIREPETFDRLVFTDVHVGMETDPDGDSIYGMKWNEEEVMKSAQRMVVETIKFSRGKELYIDNLGDFFDGYEKLTTRGGHELPQNMTTAEAFKIGLEFFCYVIDNLKRYYKKIIVNNVCNNNHGGSMDEILSISLSHLYSTHENIEINTISKFLHHYEVGNHCFVITHGKDKRHLKYGWKQKLTPDVASKIEGFLRHKNIDPKVKRVQVDKGDNHLRMTDDGTSDFFTYNVHPALSPSSSWVQHNFKKGTRGFTLYNFEYESFDFIVKNKNL